MRLALALVALLVGPALAQPSAPPTHPPGPKVKPSKKVQRPVRDAPDTIETESMQPQLRVIGPTPAVQHKEGDYGGVEPGQTPASMKKHPAKNTLNWVGFEAKAGGASVFFQATAPFEVTQHVEGAQVVAMLSLPRMGPNAWRQIDTRYFENPLSGVLARTVSAHGATKTAAAHGAGIEVRFAFKTASDAKEATLRTATEADGQYYVYFSFPPGAVTPAQMNAKPDLK